MTAVDEPPPVRNDARPDVASILAGAVDWMKAENLDEVPRAIAMREVPAVGEDLEAAAGDGLVCCSAVGHRFIWEMSVKTCRGEESPCAGIPPSGPKGDTK